MKVAVCSSDGKNVDTHFGNAECFYIYEICGDRVINVDVRETEKYCLGPDAPPDPEKMADKIMVVKETLKDCSMLFTAKIGHAPRRALVNENFKIVECEEPVNLITDLIEKK